MSYNDEGTLQSVADPKVNKIVNRTLNIARLAAHKAVAHASDPKRYKISSDPKSLERLMLQRVATRRPDVMARAASRTRAFLALTRDERARRFGDLAAVDLGADASVDEQVLALPVPADLRLDPAYVAHLLDNHQLFLDGSPEVRGQLTPRTEYDGLELRLRKIRCADVTNGFLGSNAGDDEILIGGTSVDENGGTRVVKSSRVRNDQNEDFSDGESKTYNPPRKFTSFSLREGGNTWPKTYYVSLIFCEQDNGGFPEALEDILEKLKGFAAPLLAASIGGVAGSLIPIPGLGPLIGAGIGALIGGMIQLFIDIWEDDVFPAFTTWATIRSYNHTFSSGGHVSKEMYFCAAANGGKYECWYDWRVYS